MRSVRKIFDSTFLTLVAVSIVGPLIWVLMSSLKPGYEILRSPWSLPKGLDWTNYGNAWNQSNLASAFLNSTIVCVVSIAILLPIGAMASYVLVRYPFKGSNIIFGAFLGGMMFPNFLIIVPLYFLLRSLSLLDSLTGLTVVYIAYSLSFTIFVLSGFFQSLPGELAEAASIDGCGHGATFWKIMLPLARPGMLVVGIFNAIGLWNEYGLALVLVPTHHTLPVGVADLVSTQQYQADWGALFAALVIAMVPVLIVYWIFRNKIQESMLAGAIKG